MFTDDPGNIHNVDPFPSGAIVVLVVAALAISSVLVTLICLALNARRRRNMTLPSVVRTPPIIFAPPSQVHPSDLPMYYTTQNGIPKPINIDAPPTYEEALSAPTSPRPRTSPTSPSGSTLSVAGPSRAREIDPATIQIQLSSVCRRPQDMAADEPQPSTSQV